MDITLHIPKKLEQHYLDDKLQAEFDRLLSGTIDDEFIMKLKKSFEESKSNEGWIPVKCRELDEEEREYYDDDVTAIVDCPLPDHGDKILISVFGGKYVITTLFYKDGCGAGDEYNYDWTSEVDAWMPLPKGYVKNSG